MSLLLIWFWKLILGWVLTSILAGVAWATLKTPERRRANESAARQAETRTRLRMELITHLIEDAANTRATTHDDFHSWEEELESTP